MTSLASNSRLKQVALLVFLIISGGHSVFAQDGVLIDYAGSTRDNSAVLDVRSSTQGAMVPRMTEAQRDLISLPATSLLIFQTDNSPGYYYNSGTAALPDWQRLLNGNTPLTGSGVANYVTKWGSATDLATAGDGALLGTSGSSSATRTLTLLENGDPQLNFGSYPGAWTSALQIQNDNNTDYVWISPLDDASNARIRTGGSGLDIYVGGANDAGTYSTTFAADGNVGIGVPSPTYKLDVSGTSRFSKSGYPIVIFNNTNNANYGLNDYTENGTHKAYIGMGGSTQTFGADAAYAQDGFSINADGAGVFNISNRGTSKTIHLNTGAEGSSNFHTLTVNNGNVGIGNVAPSYKLDVSGGGTTARFQQNGSLAWTSGVSIDGPGSDTYIFNESATNGYTRIRNTVTGQYAFTNPSGTNNIWLDANGGDSYINSGDVGIGTTDPDQKLHVAGGTEIEAAAIEGNSTTRIYRNLVSNSWSGGQTGVLVIQTNVPQDEHTMTQTWINLKRVYSSGPTNSEILASGYWSSEGNGGFQGLGYTSSSGENLRVRFMRNSATGMVAIVLGETTTSWSYPNVSVTKMSAHYGIASDSYADGWTATITTSLAGLINSDDVPNTSALPQAGSSNYIQNQFSGAQTADFWVSGDAKIQGNTYIGTNSAKYLYESGDRIYVAAESTAGVAQFASYGMYLPRTGQTYNLYLGGSLKVGHGEAGHIDFDNTNTRIEKGSNNAIRLTTNSGYIDVGAQNTTYAHLSTDRPNFYFNKGLYAGAGNVFLNTSAGNSYVGAGNFGIGATGPVAKLEIDGGSANWNETTAGTGVGSIHLDPGVGTAHYGNAITWGASDAGGGDNAHAGIYVRSDGSYGTKMYFGTTDSYAAGSKMRMMINSNGNVGIGTASPSRTLHVNGQILTAAINETSDMRLKKDIADLSSSLAKVLEMRGVTYNWRKDEFPDKKFEDGLQYGLIAQELEKIIPELVDTDDEGWKSIEYSHLVPLLIEAIKEQQLTISDQSKSIENLSAENASFEQWKSEMIAWKEALMSLRPELKIENLKASVND